MYAFRGCPRSAESLPTIAGMRRHAEILENRTKYIDIWPLAQRYVRVTAKQIYGNCKARIPRMRLIPPSDSDLQDD